MTTELKFNDCTLEKRFGLESIDELPCNAWYIPWRDR